MPKSLIRLGIPDIPSGLRDKDFGLVSPLYRALSSLGQQVAALLGAEEYDATDMARMPATQLLQLAARSSVLIVRASEQLNFGKAVNIYDVSGTITARLATAADLARPAHGFVATPQGIPAGGIGMVTFMTGLTPGVVNTVVGTAYYLSTDGNIQAVSPTADDVINQIVGVGMGSDGLMVNIEPIGRRVSYMYKPSAAILRVQYTDGQKTDIAV